MRVWCCANAVPVSTENRIVRHASLRIRRPSAHWEGIRFKTRAAKSSLTARFFKNLPDSKLLTLLLLMCRIHSGRYCNWGLARKRLLSWMQVGADYQEQELGIIGPAGELRNCTRTK